MTPQNIKTTENLADLFTVMQKLSLGDWLVFCSIIIGAMVVFALFASMFPLSRKIFLRYIQFIEALTKGEEKKDA